LGSECRGSSGRGDRILGFNALLRREAKRDVGLCDVDDLVIIGRRDDDGGTGRACPYKALAQQLEIGMPTGKGIASLGEDEFHVEPPCTGFG
jgi:hypothetical protein